MGRSVSYPSGAFVTFAETPREPPWCATCGEFAEENNAGLMVCACGDDDEMDWHEGEIDWRDLCQAWSEYARSLWPSMWDEDKWIGGGRSEDHVLAANQLAYFGVSEYCGVMSFWLVPRDDGDWPVAFGEAWCRKAFPALERAFGEFRKVATMSNGESVYSRVMVGA